MLFDVRRYAAPRLDAGHASIDVRLPFLRVSHHRGRNVATDYALLERAAPFVHRLRRPQISVLFDGDGRVEEADRRVWFGRGTLLVSDASEGGTEAYAGPRTALLSLTWDPAILGAPFRGGFAITSLAPADARSLRASARALGGPRTAHAIAAILATLRALGVPFAPLSAEDLPRSAPEGLLDLQTSVAESLSRLDRHPDLEDVRAKLGWNRRTVHRRLRRLAHEYDLAWTHWREALHQARLLHALRLLSAPGATTELVADLAGFRAATSLCHAFAEAGLPSPAVLARAARGEVLGAWSELAPWRPPRELSRDG